ncbi:hypothetical protein GCM10010521_26770 [Streptomyces rameus]|uniref:Uncharacterized protein n=1 Tax=Streptomyces rameus TaxID=68261 RepID=A0ABP6N7L1_9ACTN
MGVHLGPSAEGVGPRLDPDGGIRGGGGFPGSVHGVGQSGVHVVDGRVLTRDRELLTLEMGRVVRELTGRLPAPTARDHGRRVQEYGT